MDVYVCVCVCVCVQVLRGRGREGGNGRMEWFRNKVSLYPCECNLNTTLSLYSIYLGLAVGCSVGGLASLASAVVAWGFLTAASGATYTCSTILVSSPPSGLLLSLNSQRGVSWFVSVCECV